MTSIFRGRRSTFETSMFICVAGAALSTCRAACFLRIALSGLHQLVTMCKLRGRHGTWQAQHLVKIRRAWNVILCGRQ